MRFSDGNEAEVVSADPRTEVAEILWMDNRHVHLLLPNGEEVAWPISALVGQLRGIDQVQIQVVDGDVTITPVSLEAITA